MKMEIDFVMVNNLWLMKKDLTLIEKTLEKTNFPPNLIVKPSLERKSLYLPTTLEAREHCEPFQKFDAYMREKLGKNYDYFKASYFYCYRTRHHSIHMVTLSKSILKERKLQFR